MSQEALEAKIVQKAVSMLRMARNVIEKLHDDNEKGFQEEPSLSDLVLVAQIIGQTSMIDRLGEAGLPEGAELPTQSISGTLIIPDIVVFWNSEGWHVNAHPDFNQEAKYCQNAEELLAILQQMAIVCGQNRMP